MRRKVMNEIDDDKNHNDQQYLMSRQCQQFYSILTKMLMSINPVDELDSYMSLRNKVDRFSVLEELNEFETSDWHQRLIVQCGIYDLEYIDFERSIDDRINYSKTIDKDIAMITEVSGNFIDKNILAFLLHLRSVRRPTSVESKKDIYRAQSLNMDFVLKLRLDFELLVSNLIKKVDAEFSRSDTGVKERLLFLMRIQDFLQEDIPLVPDFPQDNDDDENQEKFIMNQKAYWAQRDELLSKYLHKFVAFKNQQLVAIGNDYESVAGIEMEFIERVGLEGGEIIANRVTIANTLTDETKRRSPWIKLLVTNPQTGDSVRENFLIDTGADTTCLSWKIIKLLQLHKQSEVRAKLGGTTHTQDGGYYFVRLSIPNADSVKCFSSTDQKESLIGMNCLNCSNLNVTLQYDSESNIQE
jgi:predicted aspartyl protease